MQPHAYAELRCGCAFCPDHASIASECRKCGDRHAIRNPRPTTPLTSSTAPSWAAAASDYGYGHRRGRERGSVYVTGCDRTPPTSPPRRAPSTAATTVATTTPSWSKLNPTGCGARLRHLPGRQWRMTRATASPWMGAGQRLRHGRDQFHRLPHHAGRLRHELRAAATRPATTPSWSSVNPSGCGPAPTRTFLGGSGCRLGRTASSCGRERGGLRHGLETCIHRLSHATPGAFDRSYNGGDHYHGDAFVVKLNSAGSCAGLRHLPGRERR